jgi:hypothetical protein
MGRHFGGLPVEIWAGFYTVIGTAAAALMGLLFVVISVNAPETLGPGRDMSRRLAEQAFQNYLVVLMTSLLALMPAISRTTFGAVTLMVIAAWIFWVFIRLYQVLVEPGSVATRISNLRRHLPTLIGFGLVTFAAGTMALTPQDERYMFAGGSITLLFAATAVSWQFLSAVALAEAKGKHHG